MNQLIQTVLNHKAFETEPPVCVDLGASGGLPKAWDTIAPYSIAVAFDADTRNFNPAEKTKHQWRRLIKVNRLVTDKCDDTVKFYLTKSPGCSSSLPPDCESLEPWLFSDLFEVVESASLPAVQLTHTLKEAGIDYIDWLKLDTQGTDLRIFTSLSERIRKQALIVEFEPGIINAYKGEDKLYHVLEYMESLPFFLSDMKVLGSKKLSKAGYQTLKAVDGDRDPTLRLSPCWVEMCYLNSLTEREISPRSLLLTWVFATMQGQHGHALLAAQLGWQASSDPQFQECERASLRELRRPDYSKLGVKSVAAFLQRRISRLLKRQTPVGPSL